MHGCPYNKLFYTTGLLKLFNKFLLHRLLITETKKTTHQTGFYAVEPLFV